jgi:hypothetical protein
VKLARFKKPKATCFLSYVDYINLKQLSQNSEKHSAQGRSHMREGGKRRKLRR